MHCSFDPTELHSMELHSARNKLDCYKGKNCMEKFCKDLRGHAIIVINYEKKNKKKRYHWLTKKISFMKSKKFVTFPKKNLVLKKLLNCT